MPAADANVEAAPLRAVGKAERLHTAARVRRQRRGIRTVDTEQRQSAARHQVDEPPKREPHFVDVAIDVGVIELDVVDDGDVGQVLQELRRLVEVGAVVLVAFDDERLALADAIARAVVAEVPRDAADEHRRIRAGRGQQPPGQRRRRGLAVRAGDHDRVRVPQPLIANRFRQRRVANAAVEHGLELRVAARDGVADHDQIRGRVRRVRRDSPSSTVIRSAARKSLIGG